MTKKILAAVMAVTFVFGGAAVVSDNVEKTGEFTVYAAEMRTGKCGEGLSYYINNGVLNISGFGEMTNWSDSVTSPWKDDETIKKVVVGSGVKSIGTGSFRGCICIEEAELPDTLTTINPDAFYGCDSLKEINIPDSVTEIGTSAFEGCRNATSVHIPKNITYIGNWVFKGCIGLEKVDIPEGVKNINDGAFDACMKLSEVNIPESVEHIAVDSFQSTPWFNKLKEENEMVIVNHVLLYPGKCEGEVIIPDGVRFLPANVFSSKYDMTSVVMPDSVTEMYDGTFAFCDSLESVTLSKNLKTLPCNAFYKCGSLKSIELPEGIEVLADKCLHGCDKLKSITVPKSVTRIGSCALGFTGDEYGENVPKIEGFEITGYKGTPAEEYANKHGFKFTALDKDDPSSEASSDTSSKTSSDPSSDTSSKPEPAVKFGDINSDGNIDIEDAVMVISHINGVSVLSDAQMKAADVDKSGNVDIEDAVAIISHVNGVKVLG